MDPRLRALALLCAVVLCAAAALREISVWRSDIIAQQRTPERLSAALAYTPADAAKWRQLGMAQLQSSLDSAASAFRQAVKLNRFETDALLGLAVHAESQQRHADAESLYLQAVGTSRRFKARYALAGFYARTGRGRDFQQTAAAAAAIDKADTGRIVRLARDAGVSPDDIPVFLNLRTEHALAAYLQIAIAENRPRPLAQVALRLPATPEHLPKLVQACERLIADGAVDGAVAVWNRVNASEKLDVAAGRSLTDSGFSNHTTGGFNWRHSPVPGVQYRSASGLRIELSGDQPEHVLLLDQFAPVLPRRSYRFSVRFDAAQLSTTAGLAWQIQCVSSPEPIAIAQAGTSSAGITSLAFSTRPGRNLIRIMLVYRRQPGTVRIAGTIGLLSAQLELLP